MNRNNILAFLAGAIVTVVVYEGTARLNSDHQPEVVVQTGQTHETGAQSDDGRPRQASLSMAGSKTPSGSNSDSAQEAALSARIDQLTAELEALKANKPPAEDREPDQE